MKRVLAILLAIVCVTGLAGCADDNSHSEDENGAFVGVVTAVEADIITLKITDTGNTNFEMDAMYSISKSDEWPEVVEGEYIRVVCNPSAGISQSDPPLIEMVNSINKTDETGKITAD